MKKKSGTSYEEKKKKSYKGFNSRKKTSFNKNSKHYKKKYSEQELSATHVEKNLKPRKPYKSAKQFCYDSAKGTE